MTPAPSAGEEVDPDAVSAAALSCPDVAALSGGIAGEVATYLPGRRVPGVRLNDDEVEIHIVARWRTNLPEVADAVRRAVRPVTGGRRVSVYVEDIEVPGEGPALTEQPSALTEQGAGGAARS
ncbi:MAG: hypothetical protein M3N28_01405 [Actinomycetota bacterium]|nr:hypothetical protein [Actinomycetota bacterium]